MHTSTVFSSEQTRLSSSPVPVPEIADIGSGENLIDQQNVSKNDLNAYNKYTIKLRSFDTWIKPGTITSEYKFNGSCDLNTYIGVTIKMTQGAGHGNLKSPNAQ